MTVTVGIPFYGDSEMLGRCVRSLVHQTHDDLRVLIIGDGQEPNLNDIPNDSRVDLYTLPENKGAYFARAVSLAATDTEHHAVVDSDDWLEPHWLETMLATGGSAIQHGSRFVEVEGKETQVLQWKHARRPLATKLLHYTSHTGVYETERLRKAGGYSPAYRVGYDSLLCAVLRVLGDVAIVDEPLYHRRVHAASLSNAPSTRIGSPARLRVRNRLDMAYRRMWRMRNNPTKVKQILDGLTPKELWDEVNEHAERVHLA